VTPAGRVSRYSRRISRHGYSENPIAILLAEESPRAARFATADIERKPTSARDLTDSIARGKGRGISA
jgi:hypothetical protein